MLACFAKPRPPLAGLVDLLWALDTPRREAGLERVLPSGSTDLVFNLADPARPAFLCGPQSEPFVLRREERESFVGVHFKPGGAAALLGLPESELANRRIGLDAIWGREAIDVCERLALAATPEAALQRLEAELIARLAARRPRHPAVAYALSELAQVPAPRSIGEIGMRAGLSRRRFIEVFTAQVGLSPKLFARVQRFQRVLQLAHARAKPDWSALALTCGYYDQAHLARDFGEFAAVSPGAYLGMRSEDRNHLSLGNEGQIRPSRAAAPRARLVAGERSPEGSAWTSESISRPTT